MQIVDRGAVLLRDARGIHAGGLRKQRIELRNCRFSGRSLLRDELPRGNDRLAFRTGVCPGVFHRRCGAAGKRCRTGNLKVNVRNDRPVGIALAVSDFHSIHEVGNRVSDIVARELPEALTDEAISHQCKRVGFLAENQRVCDGDNVAFSAL